MQRKQQYVDKAYILHCRPYRNTSLIADILTREHGRINVIARGAKRGQHPLAALLQPFSPLQIQWGGASELMTLYKVEQGSGTTAPLNIDMFSGFYINELLIRLLHRHDPHPQLYDCYAQCLASLNAAGAQDIALRYFELELLEELGYAMNLHADVATGTPLEPMLRYHYLIEQGPSLAGSHATGSLYISGATLIALAERQLTGDAQRNEARQLMRAVLDHYLGHRPLKSRELLMSKKLLLASESPCD